MRDANDPLAPLGGQPFDDRRDHYTKGTYSVDTAAVDTPPCDDPERVTEHPLGTDGSCHTCAMALGPDYALLPDAVDMLRARARTRRLA